MPGRVAVRKVSFFVFPRKEFLEIFQEGKMKTCDGLLCENRLRCFTSHGVSSKRKEGVLENPSSGSRWR